MGKGANEMRLSLFEEAEDKERQRVGEAEDKAEGQGEAAEERHGEAEDKAEGGKGDAEGGAAAEVEGGGEIEEKDQDEAGGETEDGTLPTRARLSYWREGAKGPLPLTPFSGTKER